MDMLVAQYGGVPLWDIVLQVLIVLGLLLVALRQMALAGKGSLSAVNHKQRELRESFEQVHAELLPLIKQTREARRNQQMSSREGRNNKDSYSQYGASSQSNRAFSSPALGSTPGLPAEADVYVPSIPPPLPSAPPIFYAKVPERDGTFKVSNLSAEISTETLYEISVIADGLASITLHGSPDRFRTALQAPHIYLDPACHYEEEPPRDASVVTTLRPGRATLANGRWTVAPKLEINFR